MPALLDPSWRGFDPGREDSLAFRFLHTIDSPWQDRPHVEPSLRGPPDETGMAELETAAFYEAHADFCRICANAKRLKILDLLADGQARTVSTIEAETGITQSTLSQHLKVMRDQGILEREKEGVRNYYSIGDPRVVEAVEIVQDVIRDRMDA